MYNPDPEVAEMPKVITLKFAFRWSVKQTSETTIEVQVPYGQGVPVIHPPFADNYRLTEAELERAETAVLRSIAIVPES